MSKKSAISSWIIAFAGVVIGVMSYATYERVCDKGRALESGMQNYAKLNAALKYLEDNYVDSVDRSKLTDAALSAALQALDPHSMYFPPVDYEAAEEQLAGDFDGIGIQFNVPNDTAIVLEVIAGGPSEKIGIQTGDKLIKVDQTVIAGVNFPQDSMVRKMRGKSGSKVCVTVLRDGELIPFDITRGKIPVCSVDASFMASPGVGYIRLAKFSRTTFKDVTLAAKGLLEQGMTKLIFDIRDNTGGYLDQALMLSNMFLEKNDMVVYIEGSHREREEFRADGRGMLKDVKLCVLIDEGSASSSEIFAGAVQDNGRGTIIGRRSFGKGLVQEPVEFVDGSGMRLTVARYYTPSGRCLQKPYSEDYDIEVYKRFTDGQLVNADSVKLDSGGIIPDVFVAIDTSHTTDFYVSIARKATPLRFASYYFDSHKKEISLIDSYEDLDEFFSRYDIEREFLDYALGVDGLRPSDDSQWIPVRNYVMTQVRGLIGRYSKIGGNAFYRVSLDIDDTFRKALELI